MAVLEDDCTTTAFDPSTTAPSTALIEAIAAAEGVIPDRLFDGEDVGIHDFVDPDGLDRLLTDHSGDVIEVSATVYGHPVRIRSNGLVVVDGDRGE